MSDRRWSDAFFVLAEYGKWEGKGVVDFYNLRNIRPILIKYRASANRLTMNLTLNFQKGILKIPAFSVLMSSVFIGF